MLWSGNLLTSFGGDVMQTILLVNHELMRIMIQVNSCGIDSNVLIITEEFGHLLKWNALGFWQDEPRPHSTQARDDDEDQVELPANVGKRRGGRLKVDQVGDCNGGHGQADALCTHVVREELAVERNARDINTDGVHCQEYVESSHTHSETCLVRSFVGVFGDHGGFDDQTNCAACDTENHERTAADFVTTIVLAF